jgi:hypothetical protein
MQTFTAAPRLPAMLRGMLRRGRRRLNAVFGWLCCALQLRMRAALVFAGTDEAIE